MINDDRLDFITNSKEIEIYIPELLRGIQDMNWPTARRIASFLRPISHQVYPYVKPILVSDDTLWIYWVLNELVRFWPNEIVKRLEIELKYLARKLDIYEETDLIAIGILANNSLDYELGSLLKNKEDLIRIEISSFSNELISEFEALEKERLEILRSDPSLITNYVHNNDEKLNLKYKYETLVEYQESLLKLGKGFES